MVKRYVRRYLNTVSSYILGEDVIENKWFKLFKQSVVCSDIFCCLAWDVPISNFELCLFPIAGRFFLMRRANLRREAYQTPWSLQNTTVSYRQIQPRAKHDGPGTSQPYPKHFAAAASSKKHCRSFWFPVPLSPLSKQHDWLERTLTVLSFLLSFMKCLLHPRSLSVGHKRFILFFYYYFI